MHAKTFFGSPASGSMRTKPDRRARLVKRNIYGGASLSSGTDDAGERRAKQVVAFFSSGDYTTG